jgi:NAD-dependent protein deacetylase/lipoamidase
MQDKTRSERIPLEANDRLFVLTGAGASAESGLATFRGAGGLWEGHRVEEVASPHAWARDPEQVWRFYSMRRNKAAAALPNAAHTALAALEHVLQPQQANDGLAGDPGVGSRFFLCTQNVDDLHERAGSRRLVHMHGELFRSRCERCSRPPFADTQLYETLASHRFCECGGRIRPDIVWFGETPFHMERIFEELQRCTVMLVVGTSGLVQPAASFVQWAGAGVRTYYIGPEHPANGEAFTQVFEGKAGDLLPRLFPLLPH